MIFQLIFEPHDVEELVVVILLVNYMVLHIAFYLFFTDFKCVEDASVYGNKYDPLHGNCTCKSGRSGIKCQGKGSL